MFLETSEEIGTPAAAGKPTDLLMTLMSGLHAAAQPLTLLRLWIDEERALELSERELRRIVIESAPPVERMCGLVSSMQQLLTIETHPPAVRIADAAAVAGRALEGVQHLYADSGVELESLGTAMALVTMDPKRFEQAVATSALFVHGISERGDRVNAHLELTDDTVTLCLSNPRRDAPPVSPDAQLGLAIAGAALRSQGGAMTIALNPVELRLRLPRFSDAVQSPEGLSNAPCPSMKKRD